VARHETLRVETMHEYISCRGNRPSTMTTGFVSPSAISPLSTGIQRSSFIDEYEKEERSSRSLRACVEDRESSGRGRGGEPTAVDKN